MLRDPVERMWSEYIQSIERSHGMHSLPSPSEFHVQIVDAIKGMQSCLSKHGLFACAFDNTGSDFLKYNVSGGNSISIHLQNSMYVAHLSVYLQVFPRDQILVIKNEDFGADPSKTMAEVWKFLGVPPTDDIHVELPLPKNSMKEEAGEIIPLTKKMLKEFFNEFNVQLSKMLCDERFKWSDA